MRALIVAIVIGLLCFVFTLLLSIYEREDKPNANDNNGKR